MVSHTFSYWIENYYAALQHHIALRQQRDPLVWQDLSSLVLSVQAWRKARLKQPLQTITAEDTARFLQEELTEAAV